LGAGCGDNGKIGAEHLVYRQQMAIFWQGARQQWDEKVRFLKNEPKRT
jgi:hypothetical protein